MQTQARVGYLLATMAGLTYLFNMLSRLAVGASLESMLSLSQVSYLLYLAVFIFTSKVVNRATSILQVLIIGIESIVLFTFNPAEWFFGAALMIIAIFLAYAYGLFFIAKWYKVLCVALIQYLLFILIPLSTNPAKYIRAAQWVTFISVFIFALWFIFKDSIARISSQDAEAKKRLYDLLSRSMWATENAISIGQEALIELKKISGEDK